jgi:hypothetical protein
MTIDERRSKAAAILGAAGGRVRVAKGFAKMDPTRLAALGPASAKKRVSNRKRKERATAKRKRERAAAAEE